MDLDLFFLSAIRFSRASALFFSSSSAFFFFSAFSCSTSSLRSTDFSAALATCCSHFSSVTCWADFNFGPVTCAAILTASWAASSPEAPAAAATSSAVCALTEFGFMMAAQAIVPQANLASFFVGPEPKKIFGSTCPCPGHTVTLYVYNIVLLFPCLFLIVSTIFSVTSSNVGGGQCDRLALEHSWNTGWFLFG